MSSAESRLKPDHEIQHTNGEVLGTAPEPLVVSIDMDKVVLF